MKGMIFFLNCQNNQLNNVFYLGCMKRLIRSGHLPLQQFLIRTSEALPSKPETSLAESLTLNYITLTSFDLYFFTFFLGLRSNIITTTFFLGISCLYSYSEQFEMEKIAKFKFSNTKFLMTPYDVILM